MSLLKKMFGKKDEPINSYSDFWNWFQNNEKTFHHVVKQHKNIEKEFFDIISPKLLELKEGFFFLTGMFDDNTVELILTPDGIVKNIVFIEELVQASPKIEGWKFTALKPASNITDFGIEMAGLKFNEEKLSFYSNDNKDFPDEIDLTIVHHDLNEENKATITNGTFIFLDNFLGELDFVSTIDKITVVGKSEVVQELVPIGKLKDFLIWRQKEFIEKYDGVRYDTENDSYSSLEATLKSGNPLIAIVNSTLLNWDDKASHPWILYIEIRFDGKDNNGLPDNDMYQFLNKIEDIVLIELKDADGYLNIGRQTAENVREIYFACKDFRKPSKVLHKIIGEFSPKIEISYDLYKDKYWQSFDRFIP
jgi:Family of unknown function (DUF695)